MNGLDIVFIIIILLGLVRGLFRGLVKEFASIVGLVFGFLVANQYYQPLTEQLMVIMPDEQIAGIVSYAFIFLAVLGAILLAGLGFRELLKLSMLSWLDRLSGGILGLLKGGLICSLVLLLLTTFMAPGSALLQESRLSPYIGSFTQQLSRLIPKDMKAQFEERSQDLQESWKGSLMYKLQHPEEQGEQ